MRSTAQALAIVGVLGIVVGASGDRQVVSAQAEASHVVKVDRLYTGPDGLTYLDQVELPTGMIKIAGFQCRRAAPDEFGEWHPAPRRQYVVTLRGIGEIEASGGGKFRSGAGHMELLENTTGKGHRTRRVGPDHRVSCQLALVDQ